MKNKRNKEECIGKSDALFSRIKRLKAGFVCLLVAVALQLIARNVPIFAEWYASEIYKLLAGSISRISGLAPFSVAEIGLYLLLGFGVAGLGRGLFRLLRSKEAVSDVLLQWASWSCFWIGMLFLFYTLTCGINYHRTSFAQKAGIEVEKYSVEDLLQTATYLTEEVNQLSDKVERNEDGSFLPGTNTNRYAVTSMERLAKTYPALAGYYPRPKPVFFSEILSYQHLTGIYAPFTVEANYNADMPAYNIPFTMCHELSHLRGFMSEDEANFIAYVSCMKSEQIDFRYSGALSGWVYVTNALYEESVEDYQRFYEKLQPEVKLDLEEDRIFWEDYDGVTAEVADKVNDVYLKANRQTDGVKSYGKVVDLILAYEKK